MGLNVTRALTCKYNAQLSAGRVQTPTLALIADREQEIRRFVPKEFYGLRLKLDGFWATWRDSSGSARTFDKSLAEQVAEAVRGKSCVLAQVKKDYHQTPPPALYDLTELQRDANRKYAYSAKQTLDIMQSLYERHKVLTYPRTDSRYIPQDVVPTLPSALQAVMVGDYKTLAQSIYRSRPLQTRYIVNDAKVTDHHAIIPTEQAPDLWQMTGPERNIYDLVVRRFLAALLPPFAYEEVRLTMSCGKHTFTAKGKVILERGWKAAYRESVPEDETEEEADQTLPPMQQGQRLPILEAKVTTGKTAPPARYTEATLLTAMEHPPQQVTNKELSRVLAETAGLGTPATRADIIEKLFSMFAVERRGKEIVPTSKGLQLVELAPQDLRSAELTARWEQRLAQIAQGKASPQQFETEIRHYATRLVEQVKVSDARYVHDNQTRKPCPDCGKLLLLVNGKRGQMLVCPDRECGYRKSLSQTTNARCPNCHKKMELRGEGDKRMFACACGYRQKLSEFQENKRAAGAGKREVQAYLQKQEHQSGNNAMASQLTQWLAQNKK